MDGAEITVINSLLRDGDAGIVFMIVIGFVVVFRTLAERHGANVADLIGSRAILSRPI